MISNQNINRGSSEDLSEFLGRKIELIHKLMEMDFLFPDDIGNGLGASLPGPENGKKFILRFKAKASKARKELRTKPPSSWPA